MLGIYWPKINVYASELECVATSLYFESQPFLISQHLTNAGVHFNTFVAADHNINLIYFTLDIRLFMLILQIVVLCIFFYLQRDLQGVNFFLELIKKRVRRKNNKWLYGSGMLSCKRR